MLRSMAAAPRQLAQTSSHLKIAAVVLAAGQAQRLGGQPKPLLRVDGVPLIRSLAQALDEAGVAQTVVVTGHRADEIEAALAGAPARCVHNPDYADGPGTSLRSGLAALPAALDGILVALADQPLLTAADIAALLEAFAHRGDADIVRPRARQRLGNPIVMAASLRATVTAGPPQAGARHWMDRNPARVAYLDTVCEHYFIDIDTPEDLCRLRQQTGRELRLPNEARHA